MITTGDASELQQQLARGDIVEVQSPNEVSWLKNQELPRYMFESEQWLDRDVELGTFSRQNAGIREQGVSTVGQQSILSTACPQVRGPVQAVRAPGFPVGVPHLAAYRRVQA